MGASIRGIVKDGEGKPLTRVKVVAAHEPTGSQFAKLTDHEGRFLFDNIKVGGPYAVTASGEGLATAHHRLKLKTDQAVDCEFTMHAVAADRTDDESHTSA